MIGVEGNGRVIGLLSEVKLISRELLGHRDGSLRH